MSLFVGEYSCKADSKYRAVVPASFRKAMMASDDMLFVIRKNVFEPCLDMYPCHVWEEMVAKLRAGLNMFDRKHAAFLREFHRGVQEVEMDASGRVLLPRRLLEEVGIDKDMVFAAQDSVIQIWAPSAYGSAAIDGEELGKLAEEIFKK